MPNDKIYRNRREPMMVPLLRAQKYYLTKMAEVYGLTLEQMIEHVLIDGIRSAEQAGTIKMDRLWSDSSGEQPEAKTMDLEE